ncbi:MULTISPECIES: dermonecrotic toxin domain-containing protein [unclassified Pseudomonas]|uniref:dermonecrotic toxin domain-containing protein n=2 Tax=Pseudomonas TaxID=286 RepID=UPI0015A12EF0|nr:MULTISPECIES: DUF6543 domain-containing protein [unclassified Pseudomonas]NWC96192.1 hypothetical protein [Pseudomonas sp. IPO3779]NWD16708.1 hypothetical protein [Pseudomonas sp. IPO3778]
MPQPSTEQESVNGNELLTQLTTGPSIREVAAKILRPALKELYPELEIDPDLAIVVSPFWLILNDHVVPGLPRHESLTGALARRAFSDQPLVYLDGEHYLTDRATVGPDLHMPVRIDAIARLINECAPLMFVAYQEQQLAFWNQTDSPRGTRWQAFANALRSAWDIHESVGWDADERAMAKNVFLYPDAAVRLPNDKYRTRACLMDIDVDKGTHTQHLSLASLAILIGTHDQHTMILTYSIANGYQKFDSQDDLSQALILATTHLEDKALKWRLYEPQGDFFEYQACALIGLQLDAIGRITSGTPPRQADDDLSRRGELEFGQLSSDDRDKLEKISDAIPEWLKSASSSDLSRYSRGMFDIATLNSRTHNKTYQDDIPLIGDYALKAIADAMAKTLTPAQKTDLGLVANGSQLSQQLMLKLKHVQITVTSQVVWGLFTVPGLTSTVTFSLEELALQNLIALPLGNKVAQYQDGRSLPSWMNVTYLQDLITQVNIGDQYPRLVKATLLDNPVQSLLRQTLYTDQLRLQLPLLALQYKIRNQHGVDEQGYRYVCAAMARDPNQRRVNGYTVVIRPLAFIPTRRTSQAADPVSNMFVIGPQHPANGPCLLYRPQSPTQLMQFASPNNLIYAIKQSSELRSSVLAWLPDSVRSDYAQFVFPGPFLASPGTLSTLLVQPWLALTMTGPVILGSQTVQDDELATLFTANAKALVELADKQSVSNAEARWESFKRAGWMIFNAALPFLGKTVGTAAWVGQLINDVQEAIDASESGDSTAKWSALTDIFLNLGMALALHLASRQTPLVRAEKPTPEIPTPTQAPAPLPVIQQPDIQTPELPGGHEPPLHTLGALTRQPPSLKKTLDSFSVTRPETLGAQQTLPGPHQHLYPLNDQWYAPVGERWFKVQVDENDTVLIVDATQPERLGPVLVNNRAGQWFVDTRLRLRGAGFRSRMKKGQRLKPVTIAGLREQLEAFDRQEAQQSAALETARSVSRAASPGTSDSALTTFIATLDKRRAEYEAPIAQLKSLNLLDVVPDYAPRMLAYLEKQLLIAQAGINEQVTDFQKDLAASGQHMGSDPQEVFTRRRIADKTLNMITQLEYVHSRFKYLRELGFEGAKLELSTRQNLPPFDLDDLKGFRISLARSLCLEENSTADMTEAQNSINGIVQAAQLTVQSARELVERRTEPDLDAHIEALDNVVDQFTVINQNLLDLPDEYPGLIVSAAVEDLRKQIDEYAQRAMRALNTALRERKTLEARAEAEASSSVSAGPPKKIIKTRFQGVVVGTPRAEDPTLVDVKAPLTHEIIATFHKKPSGNWVEHTGSTPPVSRPATVSLANSLTKAQALLDEVDGFIKRTTAKADQPQRLPVEIEEKFERRAQLLEQAGRVVEHAANATNETDNTASQAVIRQLDEAVKRLYREGRRVRLDMLKKRPPKAAYVELLCAEGEVTIHPVGARRRLKGPKKDFMQEYEVRDQKATRALWYAHFHYETLNAPDEAYVTAHLKTPEQRRLGGAFEEFDGMSEPLRRAIYRAKIGPQLARTLFLSKTLAPAT